MRVFSKLVLICNVCFIASVILRLVEMLKRSKGNYEGAIQLQPLESMLVVLGYGAIFLNVIFFILAVYFLARNNLKNVSRSVVWFNLVIFPVQVWYFFFSNF